MEKIHHTVLTRLATIILLLASTLTLASCLNETPKDQIDEDEAYGTASKLLLNAVGSLYNYIGGNADSQGLQGTYRGVYDYNTFTTDEAMILPAAETGTTVVSGRHSTNTSGHLPTTNSTTPGTTCTRS